MSDSLFDKLRPELVEHELESIHGEVVYVQIPTLGELEESQNAFLEAYRAGDEKKNLQMKDLILLQAHNVKDFVKDKDGNPRFEALDVKKLNFRAKEMVEELFAVMTGGREPKKSKVDSSSSASQKSSAKR